MKKVISLILALSVFLFICGCKKNPNVYSYMSYVGYEDVVTQTEQISNDSSVQGESSEKTDSSGSDSSVVSLPSINSSSGSNSNSDTSEPQAPIVETPTVDEKNDPITENNNKINEEINAEFEKNGSQISDGFLERVWKNVALSDGVKYSDEKTAKDTDKVSMLNLYDQPACSTYEEVEAEILKRVNGNSDKQYFNTNIKVTANSSEKFNSFAKEFYMVHGYQVYYGTAGADLSPSSSEKYIWIDIFECQKSRNSLHKTDEYKYIQQAISECGITAGMIQKDAISKFNDYICKKVEYDYENYSHDLKSFFEKGDAICNSYAQVFELMCRTVGIDAKFINGIAAGGPHAWNVVEFSDSSKYYFDICWNDCPVKINGKDYYNYRRIFFASSIDNRTTNWISPVAYMKFA